MNNLERNKDKPLLEQLPAMSESSIARLCLGLKVSMMVDAARISGKAADREFYREFSKRLYASCNGNEADIANFRRWFENGYIG